MTYYYNHYEFTAFSEDQLLSQGTMGSKIGTGDMFHMPDHADICVKVSDNDYYLSGDSYHDENANDHYGQEASLTQHGSEVGNHHQIYAERVYWVSDEHGNWYKLVEIEQEGSDEAYYAFHEGYGLPPAGAKLTIGDDANVKSDWIKYNDLSAGDKKEDGSVTGRFFFDEDCDNTEFNYDTGQWEKGVSGATVELIDDGGNVVATTTTDANGVYHFDKVEPGSYQVKFVKPDGTEFVQKDVGDIRKDSDANSDGLTHSFTVKSGQHLSELDAGVKEATGTVHGTVFCDIDCDGINGEIKVIPGCDYVIEAEDMWEWGFRTVHGDHASGGKLVKLDHAYGQGELCKEFDGKTGTYDLKIHVQDEDDGQSTIYVKIDGKVVEAIKLDDDGDGGGDDGGGFSTYVVKDVHIEHGDDISLKVHGDGYEYVRIDKIELEGKDTEIVHPEPPKEGVTIKLIDAHGNVVATTVTDADGNYQFDDVPVGDYRIMGVAPDGTEFTIQDAGNNDAIDSDVDSSGLSDVFTVKPNEKVDIDLGLKDEDPGALSGRYFCDTDGDAQDNNNGDEPGIGGVVVTLLNAAGAVVATTVTADDGTYSFADLDPGEYSVQFTDPDGVLVGKELVAPNVGDDASDSDAIGDTTTSVIEGITVVAGEESMDNDAGVQAVPQPGAVSGRYFCDTDGDAQDNNNGDEPGVGGVQVELLDAAGSVVGTTTTAADGNYRFDGVAAGEYTVRFTDPDGVLVGKELVAPNVGDDASDSDAIGDTTTSVIEGITVVAGEESMDNDAGVQAVPQPGAVSGRYFCDTDGDAQDNNNGDEPGVGGVQVELLDAAGNVVGTTTTAADGNYRFDGVAAGDYTVRFTDPDGVLDGKRLVEANVGDDASDSDAIGDTTTSVIEGITVVAGEESMDNDAGVEPSPGSLSGRYFCDTDGDAQDNNNGDEPGVGGVQVELLDAAGNVVGTTTTAADGNYSFDDLAPGSYSVRFTDPDGVLVGKELVEPNVGDDASDSDAIGDTTTSVISGIQVPPGGQSNDNDAGVRATPPDPEDDSAIGCANEDIVVDVLANDGGAAPLAVTAVNGVAIAEGETIELDGVFVSLIDDELVFDGEAQFEDLDIGEEATVSYTYEVTAGNGAVSTAQADVTFCGVGETIEEINASLPAEIGFQIIDENDPAGTSGDAFTLQVSGTGDVRLDGLVIEAAYCISAFDDILSGSAGSNINNAPLLTGDLFGVGDEPDDFLPGTGQNGLSAEENLDLITWILNQDFESQGFTDAEVQGAIWGLTDDIVFVADGAGDVDDAQEIIDLAIANGEGFEAGPGGITGLIIVPDDDTAALGHNQPFIIGVPFDDIDCIC